MTAAVLELANGTAPSTPTTGLLDIFAGANKNLSTIDDAGNVLSAPTIREAETLAVKPQQSSGNSAAPSGNVSTTEKAMGLGLVAGFTITPQVTGRVMVFIAGMALNSTLAGDGTQITGRFGTGTAPSNAATTGLGTAFGAAQHFVAGTTAEQAGFMCMGTITGQALNVPLWFDISVVAVTGGGSTVKDVQIVVVEI